MKSKETITLEELRKTELYRREQTRPLRELLKQEPVAWRCQHQELSKDYWHLSNNLDDIKNSSWSRIDKPVIEPLYTAPKQLSDEEILEELFIPKSQWDSYKAQICLKQIRKILKKAGEK